jgi:hypothetical protein
VSLFRIQTVDCMAWNLTHCFSVQDAASNLSHAESRKVGQSWVLLSRSCWVRPCHHTVAMPEKLKVDTRPKSSMAASPCPYRKHESPFLAQVPYVLSVLSKGRNSDAFSFSLNHSGSAMRHTSCWTWWSRRSLRSWWSFVSLLPSLAGRTW